MSREVDLIDRAIKDGKLTLFPIGKSTAEHECAKKKPKKKKRKGERPRPCPRCNAIVRFIKGSWEAGNQRREGWHWTNANGSQHRCSDFRETRPERRYSNDA